MEDYKYLKSKPKEENGTPKHADKKNKTEDEKDDHPVENGKKKIQKVKNKILSDEEESDIENEMQESNNKHNVDEKEETNSEIDLNSVYESAGESDISKASSIKINESKEIDAFVTKHAKRPEK